MKKNVVCWLICIAFFIIYFLLIKYIWNKFIPFNTSTDLIALFIIIFINIPLSIISTQKVFEIIKKE